MGDPRPPEGFIMASLGIHAPATSRLTIESMVAESDARAARDDLVAVGNVETIVVPAAAAWRALQRIATHGDGNESPAAAAAPASVHANVRFNATALIELGRQIPPELAARREDCVRETELHLVRATGRASEVYLDADEAERRSAEVGGVHTAVDARGVLARLLLLCHAAAPEFVDAEEIRGRVLALPARPQVEEPRP